MNSYYEETQIPNEIQYFTKIPIPNEIQYLTNLQILDLNIINDNDNVNDVDDDDIEDYKFSELEDNLLELFESEFAQFDMNIMDLPDLEVDDISQIHIELKKCIYNPAHTEVIINNFQYFNNLELRLIYILVKLGRSDINIKINELIYHLYDDLPDLEINNKRKREEVEQAEPKKKFRITQLLKLNNKRKIEKQEVELNRTTRSRINRT
jgi:hypothetical protein